MDSISAINVNGSKYYIKESDNMAKVWTHIFTAEEVGKKYAGDTDITEVADGVQNTFLATKTSPTEKLWFVSDGSYSHFVSGFTRSEDGKKYSFNDGMADYEVDSSKFESYISIFKSDFYGKEEVKFSDMNIKRGIIRISYNGVKTAGTSYTKPASKIYLIGKKNISEDGTEDGSSSYPILPITIPEFIVTKKNPCSLIFTFDLDEKISTWHTETSEFSNYLTAGSGTGTRFVNSTKKLYVGSPFTDYYTQFFGDGYKYTGSQKAITGIYIPNSELPAIGTVVEFWADIEHEYTVTKYSEEG